jgi:outer membrane protein assembly factor BamA
LRKTFNFSEKTQIATRIFAGVIKSYGNSTTAPYSEQFYIGGANSIRAYTVRTIGPGSYHSGKDSKYSYIDQTGDLKLEANVEYRFPLIAGLYGATFLDAGNIWLMKEDPARPGGKFEFKNLGRETAVGTGLGLRYDLDFLILRLDWGIALHAPYDTGKGGYFNIPRYKDAMGLHFAVGYPF